MRREDVSEQLLRAGDMDLMLAASAISMVAAGGAFAMIFADLSPSRHHVWRRLCCSRHSGHPVRPGWCVPVVHRRGDGLAAAAMGGSLSEGLNSPLNAPVAGNGEGKGATAPRTEASVRASVPTTTGLEGLSALPSVGSSLSCWWCLLSSST